MAVTGGSSVSLYAILGLPTTKCWAQAQKNLFINGVLRWGSRRDGPVGRNRIYPIVSKQR